MEQSPSWEVKRFSASQEIPSILWNWKVQLRHSQVLATWPCDLDMVSPWVMDGEMAYSTERSYKYIE
jgi:hypothetical protein